MNLFEETAAQEILSRMGSIKPATPAQWGKMNAAQMMAHCQMPFRSYFGEIKSKQSFMGKLFGKMALKKMFGDSSVPKGLPTDKNYLIADQRDFETEKKKLAECINRFQAEGYTVTSSIHPFFGKLSAQEWATLGYRHLDHHLKQFGV